MLSRVPGLIVLAVAILLLPGCVYNDEADDDDGSPDNIASDEYGTGDPEGRGAPAMPLLGSLAALALVAAFRRR